MAVSLVLFCRGIANIVPEDHVEKANELTNLLRTEGWEVDRESVEKVRDISRKLRADLKHLPDGSIFEHLMDKMDRMISSACSLS